MSDKAGKNNPLSPDGLNLAYSSIASLRRGVLVGMVMIS